MKVGDTVYYVKKSYGEHTIVEITDTEILLETDGFFDKKNRFWSPIERIIEIN